MICHAFVLLPSIWMLDQAQHDGVAFLRLGLHDAVMDDDIDRVIDRCVEAVARLQSALLARSQDNIKRYSQGYHHAFDQLRQCVQEAEPDEQQQERLRKLELQHRRMMRICQQSMALTSEDLALIGQGIAKLKQAAEVAEGLANKSN